MQRFFQQASQSTEWRAISAVILSTLVLSVDHYQNAFENPAWNSLFFYFALPALLILVVFREPLSEYGFRPGDWRFGLPASALCILAITLILPSVLRLEELKQFYSISPTSTQGFIFNTTVSLIGWEFFFRGFLLFALARIAGPYAILLQAVPFTLAHFGKPELETLSCIFGGSAFGYLAWRTKSFFYPFLIHSYLAVMIVLLAQ